MKHLPVWMQQGISDKHGKWRWTHPTCLQRRAAQVAQAAQAEAAQAQAAQVAPAAQAAPLQAARPIVIANAHKVMRHLTLGDEDSSQCYRKGNTIYVHRHVVPGSVITVYDPKHDAKAAIVMLPVRYTRPHAAIMQFARDSK
jgi:hypothetical protein